MIQLANNLEDLAEGIGSMKAIVAGFEQPAYMDLIIRKAYNKAEMQFNIKSAASAAALNIQHAYEFRTKGIHEDGTYSATAQASRLWISSLVGNGGRKQVVFAFRPAKRVRMSLTTTETGISKDNLARLKVNNGKQYPWKQKAYDVEYGKEFLLRPRADNEAKILFVPVVAGLDKPTASEKKRKFGLRKQHYHAPGDDLSGDGETGAFHAWFVKYWQNDGAALMGEDMITQFNKDARRFNKLVKVNPSMAKPPIANNIAGTVESAKRKTMKQWQLQVWGDGGDAYDGGKML